MTKAKMRFMDDGVYTLRVEMGQIGLKIFRTLRVVSELAGARAGGHGDPPLRSGQEKCTDHPALWDDMLNSSAHT